MTFAHPWWLLLVLVLVALIGGYLWLQRRRRRDTMRFTNLELLERVAPHTPGWARHIPITLVLAALGAQIVALAGPTAEATVARNRATVMLVIDVSLSMQATDVAPTRLAAAQAAAKQFAGELPPGINLGLESFAGTAEVLVSPTVDREPVTEAIDRLKLAESTATGEGIFAALAAVQSFTAAFAEDNEGPPPAKVVLMSDGKQTTPGPDGENEPRGAFTAARQAAQQHVPISTIAFGTTYGEISLNGQSVAVPVDELTMREIADLSGGSTYSAVSEQQLRDIYSTLSVQIGYVRRRVDTSRSWMTGAALLTIAGLGAALGLGRRLP
jgi:Ca-activated chloride channel family protein